MKGFHKPTIVTVLVVVVVGVLVMHFLSRRGK
jgi:uncharacterized integral membrane protein